MLFTHHIDNRKYVYIILFFAWVVKSDLSRGGQPFDGPLDRLGRNLRTARIGFAKAD